MTSVVGSVYVALDVVNGPEVAFRWKDAQLEPMREALRGVGDFDFLHGGDVDHVGGPVASVADVLALLDRKSVSGEVFFERRQAHDEARTYVRGIITTWADYHELLFPLVYSAAAAREAGATARLSLMGDLDGEVIVILVDVDTQVHLRSEDPQNLSEEIWNERLGGMASLDEAHDKWRKKQKKARRKNGV